MNLNIPINSVSNETINKSNPSETVKAPAASSQGFRIGTAVRIALFALEATLAATVIGTFTAVMVLASSVAMPILIASSVALGILLAGELISLVKPYLPETIKKVINVVYAFFADIVSYATLWSFYLLHDFEKKNPQKAVENKAGVENKTPILLVHGYKSASPSWAYHRKRLEDAGFTNIFTINLGSVAHSIQEYAQKINSKLQDLAKVVGNKAWTIIAHSMGGLVASEFATTLAKENVVSDVITLGTPFKGTKWAQYGTGECAKQMIPGAEYLKELNEKIAKCNKTRFYCLSSEADPVIIPNDSAIPDKEKQKGQFKTHTFDNMGHLLYLLSDEVINKEIKYINKWSPQLCN